jgi:uncharacterized membrane protein
MSGILVFLIFLTCAILGLAAFIKSFGHKHRLETLEGEVGRLKAEVEGLKAAGAGAGPQAAQDYQHSPAIPASEPQPVEEDAGQFQPPPEPAPAPRAAERYAAQFQSPPGAQPEAQKDSRHGRPGDAGQGKGLEEKLTSRWMVWLGGVTLAAAGVFLGKLVIEKGLMSPFARMLLGTGLGLALISAGEWLRRRPLTKSIFSLQPNYISPALSAGGVVTAFASIYVGYAFANLVSPWVAFTALAFIANGSVGLSRLQGPFLAALGITGAYAAPILVNTGSPQPWAVFPYLLIVTVAGLTMVRYNSWRWLSWLCVAGGLGWVFLWYTVAWESGDLIPVALYLAGLTAVFTALQVFANQDNAETFWKELSFPTVLHLCACGLILLAAFCLVRLDLYSNTSLALWGAFTAVFLGYALLRNNYDFFAPLGAGLSLLLLATWHLPAILINQLGYQARHFSNALSQIIVPPEIDRFIVVCVAFSIFFAAAGYLGSMKSRRPVAWTLSGAAFPLLCLLLAYWRLEGRGLDMQWAAAGLGMAAAFFFMAWGVLKRPQRPDADPATAIYVLGLFAALAFSLTMTLDHAWLSVALSLMTPAAAWVERRIYAPYMRQFAAGITCVVALRLVFNYDLSQLPQGPAGILWLAYAYVLPALSFLLAHHWFAGRKKDKVASLIQGAAWASLMAFISLSIRHLVGGGIYARYSLLEASLQTLAWGLSGYFFLRRLRSGESRMALWGLRVMTVLASFNLVFSQLMLRNPLLVKEDVGDWPLVNLITLAYAAPALLAFAFRSEMARQGMKQWTLTAGTVALFLLWADISLEVRRAFHGGVLILGETSTAEWLSYSLSWLAYAGGLLAWALYRKVQFLRKASLVIVLATVAKVFLFDMSALTGIHRVLSFLGLGLSLLGIGYLFQRYVFGAREPGENETEIA